MLWQLSLWFLQRHLSSKNIDRIKCEHVHLHLCHLIFLFCFSFFSEVCFPQSYHAPVHISCFTPEIKSFYHLNLHFQFRSPILWESSQTESPGEFGRKRVVESEKRLMRWEGELVLRQASFWFISKANLRGVWQLWIVCLQAW